MTGITLQVLPGDGIGPEIMKSTVDVVTHATRAEGVPTAFEHDRIGWEAYEAEGTTCPDRVLARAREVAGTLLGPISHLDYPARDKGGVNVSAAFRVKLDLYANIRPARTRPGLGRVRQDFDIVIVRECTEGFYPDRNMAVGSGEFMPTPDVALSVRKITSFACDRIARRAFEIASARRRKVVAVHKANNFILTDGLFLARTREVAKAFPDVQLEEIIIDAMAAHLVRDASRYDVVLATNFYADILSDLASELSGGLGLAGSINANETLCAAQAQHGSAPDIAGRDVANPTSMILSAAMLFDWLGETRQDAKLAAVGKRIHAAVEKALADPATRTRDLGGTLGTQDFGKVVVAALA